MHSFREYTDCALSGVAVSPALRARILEHTADRHPRRCRRRAAVAVLCVCLCLLLSFTAFAAVLPDANDLLYRISPAAAEFLYPIRRSTEDDGVRLEVLYAANDNHTAVVYFSVQDLAGDRVDRTIDIYNYHLDGPTAFTCERIAFDEATSTAYFRMTGHGGNELSSKLTVFCMNSFLHHKKTASFGGNTLLRDIPLDNAASLPMSQFYCSGGSGSGEGEFVLSPDTHNIPLEGVDFAHISAIGYVNQELHIQLAYDKSVDSHGYLTLTAPDGRTLPCRAYSFQTAADTIEGDYRTKHTEYIFAMADIADPSACTLGGTFTGDGGYQTGRWRLLFRLSDTAALHFDGGVYGTVELTPLGLYLCGEALPDPASVSVILRDGSALSVADFSLVTDSDGVRLFSAGFRRPVELAEIASVEIDGHALALSE